MQRMRDASIELAKGKYLFLLHHSFATGAFSQLSFDQSMGLRMAPDLSIHSENIKLDLIRPSQLQFYTNTFYSWMHFVEYCYCHFYSLVVMAMGSISNAFCTFYSPKLLMTFQKMWTYECGLACISNAHRHLIALLWLLFIQFNPFFLFIRSTFKKHITNTRISPSLVIWKWIVCISLKWLTKL